MCWNFDDDPVNPSLDAKPVTGGEIGRTLVELGIVGSVFVASVWLVTAVVEVMGR